MPKVYIKLTYGSDVIDVDTYFAWSLVALPPACGTLHVKLFVYLHMQCKSIMQRSYRY